MCAGKAGGFLALDWQDGGVTGPLGRLSFKLHQELADTLGKDIGYRRVQTLSAAAAPAKQGALLNMHSIPRFSWQLARTPYRTA